jgi:hypothetical protein
MVGMTPDSFHDSARRSPDNRGQVWINPLDATEVLAEAGLLRTSSRIDGLIIHRDPSKARGELEFRL